MNKRTLLVAGALIASFLVLMVLSVQVRTSDPGERYELSSASYDVDPVSGALLIDLDDDASAEEIAHVADDVRRAIAPYDWPSGQAALGQEISDDANLFRLFAPSSEFADVQRLLSDDAEVEGVEVERTWSVPEWRANVTPWATEPAEPSDDPGRFVPNDPYYAHQWHLDQIQMPAAWTQGRGHGVVVAVIDTGVAYRDDGGFHRAPDLGGTVLVDGYDFVDNDAFPDDEHGHGTHVAGTIAQTTNNGVGVAGVAPEAAIMPLKVLDRNGSGGWGGIAAAIRYAADHGANVINMSLGGGMSSRTVQRAIDYAHGKGVLIVAAAGNSSRGRVEYPARHDHVVAVGAVRFDRTLSFYSNYGTGLDLVAPGGDLRVDQNDDGMPDGVLQNTMVNGNPSRFDYLAWQGTSMASPHVAGVGALLYGAGVRDPDTAERILTESARDLSNRQRYGAGLVQASDALKLAGQKTSGMRGVVALGLAGFLLFGLLRRERPGSRIATTAWSVALAGGLGLIPFALMGAGALQSTLGAGVLGAAAGALGPYGALLALSVLPAFGAVALLLHVTRLRPLLVGLCIASAGALAVEALVPTVHFGLLPEALVGPWLLVQAALAFGLGALVARRTRA
ncbi:MAG: S8 family serine peptidase [Sandaracinaceae bacterium]